ncbi:MAG: hypothetical protein IJR63_01280 [Synergistaceae bacterium]|nr:hypothetical protein [Synergistaceae bacterium]
MKKTALVLVSLLLVIGMLSYVASAESADFNFVSFAKEKVLTDFHPTANPSKAVAEYDENPFEKEAGIIRARVKTYYQGWWRKHEMLVEMSWKKSNNTIMVSVLRDSNGMNLFGNSVFKENQWVSLSSVGWK